MNGDGSSDSQSLAWKNQLFSPVVNNLVRDIIQLGGDKDLERIFDQFQKELEPALRQARDRLMASAMERGLEP